jgi:hypothetical protein
MSEAGSPGQPDEAMLDLLVKHVSEGLSPAEQRVLDVLDDAVASAYLQDLERAVAAISLAAVPQALPPLLRDRLERRAESFAAATGPAAVRGTDAATGTGAGAGVMRPVPLRAARSGTLGWFAAAACLLLAIIGWLRVPPNVPQVATAPPPPAAEAPPPEAPTAAEERAALLAKDGALKVTLAATKDPAAAGVTGDVVWDPQTQKGFLHFAGLAPNDPRQREYQIWIFDAERDQRYPVDGGVFDVPAGAADVVIPIRAALLVHKAAAFAITVEKPGGTVVSARDHVVVLGAAG